jgi:hypothetical protein
VNRHGNHNPVRAWRRLLIAKIDQLPDRCGVSFQPNSVLPNCIGKLILRCGMYLMRRLTSTWSLLALSMLVIPGCGGREGPAVYPVSGIILRDGVPLPDVNVEFMPDKGRPSAATTDEDGNFVLEYVAGTQGAIQGSHKIRVMEQFLGASADGTSAPRKSVPSEPKSYELPQPVQVDATANKFTIDVIKSTATPST